MSAPGKARVRIYGLTFIVLIIAFVLFTTMTFAKVFKPVTKAVVNVETLGNSLQREADVKISGVIIGEVRGTRSTPDGRAEIDIAIDRDQADFVPANVTAQILPKTLFGERYVELVMPEDPGPPIAAGAIIPEDDSGSAIDASRMYDVFYDLLTAVPPQDLAVTLGSLNQAFSGRGERIGVMVERFQEMAEGINRELPNLEATIQDFATFADTYSDALPDIVDALDTFRTTNTTIVEQRSSIDLMLETLTLAAGDLRGFLDVNGDRIINIAADSRETLELLARYSPSYGCAIGYFADLVPRFERAFGAGTGRAGGLNVTVQLANPRGKYLPNQDEPRMFDTRGPICYQAVPPTEGKFGQYPGGAINDGAYAPPSRNPGPQNLQQLPDPLASVAPLGGSGSASDIAGSPAERDALSVVYGQATGLEPEDVPGWTTLIGAPVLRGAEVSFE
ncbi:MCE family protein [Hoyosella altamirensis]|uniref:Virulence factor Mce-like protein n=1 Tax=Hoyosella altamirensis TaxID=616997 RepID=A0A839RP30_9ACTN|nr:MCE family protein [Hoyosella altamirensis]MBB3037681.1 virulence factor Mce-like protein [Hoyosella altamirensis]